MHQFSFLPSKIFVQTIIMGLIAYYQKHVQWRIQGGDAGGGGGGGYRLLYTNAQGGVCKSKS